MIDLHVHSTASDGTCPPAELAERGRLFALQALTDHDNTDGVAEFLAATRRLKAEGRMAAGAVRMPGIELSVEPGEGYAVFHLLGLGFDPSDADMIAFERRILAGRNERNARIRANFARLGIVMPEAELARYAHGEVLARPHFARWLVDRGFAPDVTTAFETYLTRRSPESTRCYEERYHPDPGEAIDLIHAAGGIAVMAHPRFWTSDPAALRAGLRRLKDRGLDGIEARYRANLPGETVEHLRVAKELDLLVTAGSDFHGANKPDIALGMDVGDERTFCAPLCAALEKRGAVVV